MQAALLSLSKPPIPASVAPGFAFPSPTTSPGLLLKLGSLLTAHPLLQEPGARVTLLVNKLGLLPRFALLQAQGGGSGWGWPHHTPRPQQPMPEGTRLEPYLRNPNLLLALQSCHLVPQVGLAGGGGKKSCLVCIHCPHYFRGGPSPRSHPGAQGSAQGRGAPQPRIANMLQRPGTIQLVGIYRVFGYRN